MGLDIALPRIPPEFTLKDGSKYKVRLLRPTDEKAFHEFFLSVPSDELMFIKHRVTEPSVINEWCQNINFHRNLPILAFDGDKIVGAATLHRITGGWKRHVGRISVLVLPRYRGRGLARALVATLIDVARYAGVERIEAEFIGEQEAAIKMFALLGFSNLVLIENYVKDMQAVNHDYVLMGLILKTDEEYAVAAG